MSAKRKQQPAAASDPAAPEAATSVNDETAPVAADAAAGAEETGDAVGAGGGDEVAAARARERRYTYFVIAAIAVFVVVISLLAMQRYRDFYGGRYDMGNMVQAVYNTSHGHFLQMTSADGRQMSRLGSHVDPILAVFAIPWLVWPSPDMLLFFQALIVGLAAWPAYRLGRRLFGDPKVGFLLACALLIYPPLQFECLNEFHPVTLATTFLLFAFLYWEEGRFWRALPFLVLAVLCKEEIPLVVGMMGAYFALRKRSWKPLIVTVVAGIYFGLAVGVVIPHYNNGASQFIKRYSDYGNSSSSVAKNVVLKPGQTIGDLVGKQNREYWWQLLWPLLLLPLVSPLTTLIAAPELLLNALASQIWQRSIEFHYVAAEIPFLFAGALFGIARLRRWLDRGEARRAAKAEAARKAKARGKAKKRGAAPPASRRSWSARITVGTMAGAVLIGCVAANYSMGPLPFSLPGARYNGKQYQVDGHARVLAEALKMIPSNPNVKVTAENDIGSHLSARKTIYVFPYIDSADWVIVDNSRPSWFDVPDKALHDQALGQLVLNQNYQNVFAKDNVYVFKKIGNAPTPPGGPGLTPTPGASVTPGTYPSGSPQPTVTLPGSTGQGATKD